VGGLQSEEWRTEYSQTSRPEMKEETQSFVKARHVESPVPGLDVYFSRTYLDRKQ
jgi:hypothetical protein